MIETHENYMRLAIAEARKCLKHKVQSVPVGCVIVRRADNTVVCSECNSQEENQNAVMHSEIKAVYSACRILKSKYLSDCFMYVTLEPCLMCMGAILNARLGRLYFGSYNRKYGASGFTSDLAKCTAYPQIDAFGGILEEECTALLQSFFREKR